MNLPSTSSDRTRRAFALDEALTLLARTPRVFDALLRDLPPSWLTAHEGGETWSPLGVVGHLIHGERTDWLARVRIILEHGEARAFDHFNRFAQEREFADRPLAELLDLFARLRGENLNALRALHLTEDDLRIISGQQG